MEMILTQGEKMVWAAAFVRAFEKYMQEPLAIPAVLLGPEGARQCMDMYRNERLVLATNFAESIVTELRKVVGYAGVNDDAMQMLRAMLEDEG